MLVYLWLVSNILAEAKVLGFSLVKVCEVNSNSDQIDRAKSIIFAIVLRRNDKLTSLRVMTGHVLVLFLLIYVRQNVVAVRPNQF